MSASAGLLASARHATADRDWDRAEALLQRAQRIDSQNGEVYLELARYYLARDNQEAARGAAERGLLYCRGPTCDDLRLELRRSGG